MCDLFVLPPPFINLRSSIDASLKDWDVKEQANLREVEKILGRTGEILEVKPPFFSFFVFFICAH